MMRKIVLQHGAQQQFKLPGKKTDHFIVFTRAIII